MRNPIGEKIGDFKLLDKIGSGGFAEVFRAKSLRLGYEDFYVAIKRIRKDYIFKKKCEQRIKNEIKIHSELSHPAIVKFHTSFEDDEYWYLVLELCGGGSFEEFVKCKRHLSEEDACPLIKQVLNGVQYLQLKQVIHRDLSLRNILLTENGNVKIADFGLAVKCRPNEKKTSVLGTANFMSPEVVMHEPYDFKADLWSVGCILYALLYGAPPFDDKKKNSIMNSTVKSELTFPDYASNEAIELLRDMLEKDPRDRIEIKNALQYAFFQKYEKGSKKYESNNQRSGDSGMSSLSSSRSVSSRSGHKMKGTSDGERENCYENNIYYGKYFNELSNTQGSTKFVIQDDKNLGRQRTKSPCRPKLKISVPSSVSHLKNKLQPLPCHMEVYDAVLPQHAYPETREYGCEDRQKWEMINQRNQKREPFNHDNGQESQFEVPIRCRPDSPLYPPHLQNLSGENLNINSYYSCYNDIDSYKISERICKQRNFITRTNSQENILKYSCSHDQYCPPETNCLHKSNCYCHQSPMPLRNNSNSDHLSCEREEKQDLAIRNSTADENLYNVLTPLTTVRLQPKRHSTKNAIVSILDDGQVCVEFLKSKRKKNYLAHVCFISQDGIKITVFKPKKKILQSDKPPSLPDSIQEVQYYSFENLPKMHWKKYQYAKRFVDIIRAKTPKVTIYGKDAKCVMMENAPCPDYEMNFYDGYQVTEIGDKITVMDQNGIRINDENKQDAHFEFLLDIFKNMKEKCCRLEAYLENLSKACDSLGDICFPVIFGRRPNPSRSHLDDSKENASPRSMHSSLLNGTTAMKSYSGTINTDCSPCTNSSPASIPSPLSNRKSTATQKNITDIVPTLKGQPLVVKGWVIADYKDGIQMWISMSDQDVFFLDIHTKQRLSCDQHPELMTRYHTDLSSVLLYALSEEVKKTK